MAELGPDEHRGGVVEEEVGRQLLAEPRQVGGGHHQPQQAVEAGAVSPHHRVGVPPRGQQLGEVGEGAAHEGDLDDAVKRSIGSITGCTITEKAPTRAFSWLKTAITAFTFKTLLRHYAKRALNQRKVDIN